MSKEKKTKLQNFFKDLIEIISYILYTVSIYYLSHTNVEEQITIESKLMIFTFVYIAATFFYFKDAHKEILKEILKSGCILISCHFIDLIFLNKATENIQLISVIAIQVLLQSLSFAFAYIYRNAKKDFGKYTSILVLICLILWFFTAYIMKLPTVVCIIACSIVFFLFGLKFSKIHIQEKWQEQLEAKSLLQAKLKVEQQHEHEKNKLIDEINTLKEANKQLSKKLNLINNKSKRKRNK